jgi:hypothetical protein
MDDNQIAYVLNVFAQYPRCFTLEELADFADSDSDNETLKHAFLADSRFVQLEERDSNQKHLISKRSLFHWFCRLSIRLARAEQTRLDKRQLALLASSLRLDDRWYTPPAEVVEFGSHFGFVGSSYTADQYVFPIAHILSFMSHGLAADTTRRIMEAVSADTADVSCSFERLAQESIEKVFAHFTENECYVIEAREGILTGKKMTLEQVGVHQGVTRQRVNQIESRLWHRLRHPTRARLFSTALICSIISRQGSLIVLKNSPESFLSGFLARCAHVPQAEFPHSQMLILGASPEDVALLPESTGVLHEDIDTDSIATHLEAQRQLCIIGNDVKTLAENIAQSRPKHHAKPLTKGQRAYLALSAIGKPAHYTEIAEVYNSLFPDEPTTDRNLHAALAREKYGVVWIGIRGTFALQEWGYQRPAQGLFDAVTEIVREKYEDTSQPIPFAVIVAEMGKRRKVINPNSLTIAAYCNPNLLRVGKDSFIPNVRSKDTQEQISAEELDRILKEFERKDDKRPIEQELPSISGKESHPSRFSHALLSLKEKLTSLRP